MFQTSSGFNFKSVLNFIYTFSTIQDQIVLFQMIAIEKSSLLFLVHSLSFFVLFVHVSDAILYWILYLYTGPSIFDLITSYFCLFFFICTSPCLFYLSVYVCHISFSGEGLEFYEHTTFFRFFFISKCTHFFGHLKRRNSLFIFSVYFCTNLYGNKKKKKRRGKTNKSACVAYKYSRIGFP